ncbi:MAG: HlyC/CorC family transporter [Maricaulaceae bacterium]
MDLSTLLKLLAIIVLIALSGFFSGSETAFTAASRARLHALEKDGDGRAARVNIILADRERFIGAVLFGNNLVNILASALATSAFLRLFGEAGVAYATLVMTLVVLVFAEVLPKTYAIANPDKTAMGVSWLIRQIVRLFAPITSAVQTVVRTVLALAGVKTQGPVLSAHDEIRGAVDLHHQEGGVVKSDKDMLAAVLDLRELTVADVMVHRRSMMALDVDQPAERVVQQALQSRYTRLPLWSEDQENIVGVLHAKDLLRALHEPGMSTEALDLRAVAREPWFVPETTNLLEQLNTFRRKREHFAVVVDEYGAIMGIVTLEDILEEIVGEIEDEFDLPVQGLKRQPDGSVIVAGSVTIRDLNRAMEWNLPDEEAVTVAGLVIHEAQTIPEPGQRFAFHGCKFVVRQKRRNQITSLLVETITETAPDVVA